MGVFEDVVAQASRKPEGFGGVLERRWEKRTPTLRASQTGLTSSLWELELISSFALERLRDDITVLARKSVDRNIFFEPEILCASWPRLTSLLAPHGCWMMGLWETDAQARKLRFFMPVRIAKSGLPRVTVLEPLSNEYMPVGTPLLDKSCPDETMETLLRLLADPNLKIPGVVDFTHQRKSSETTRYLLEAAKRLGLSVEESNTHERAALFAQEQPENFAQKVLGRKRIREYSRQLRRLEERGVLKFEVARTEDDLLDAFESFITLELKGWKGQHGTALYNHKRIAAFSRQIVAELAGHRACEIHSMKLDGKTIAALITLGRNGNIAPWKMAFSEPLSAYSPGMQIMLKASQAMLDRKSFVEADSLAVSDHWMMNRIWPDRLTITDFAIAVRPSSTKDLNRLIQNKNRWVALKTNAKKVLALGKSLKKALPF